MTENILFEEDLEQGAKTATEQISVAGNELIKTVQSLLREAAVRKITVQDKSGRTLVEFPLYAGVIGAFFAGSWTALALIAAWFAEVSILIERDKAAGDAQTSDEGEPSAAAGAIGRATEGVTTAVSSAGTTLGAAIGDAFHSAGDLARRAADSLESRMAAGEKAAEAIIEAAAEADAAAEPQQCRAITKSGTQCKRKAVDGSDYCSVHQPK